MNNISTWGPLLLTYIIISFIFQLIKLLDQRVKQEGSLIPQRSSTKSRIFAFMIGVLLGGVFLLIIAVGQSISLEYLVLPVLTFALIAYSFGLNEPLAGLKSVNVHMSHATNFKKQKKIIGINQMPFREIDYKVRNGARFVTFEYCISPLIITLDNESSIYFIESKEDARRLGLRYMLASFFLGWYNIFSPINTIRCMVSYFRGGNDITTLVVNELRWRNSLLQQDQL